MASTTARQVTMRFRVHRAACLFALLGLLAGPAVTSSPAATLLYAPLDSLDGWSIRSVGAAAAEITGDEGDRRCARLAATGGTVFLSRELPPNGLRGSRVQVNCLVKNDDIVSGPQASCCGKLHLAVQTPRGIEHHSTRFTGTSDWRWEAVTADVPHDAQRVLLNLGLEACSGRVCFERLTVKNDQRGVHPLNLAQVANAGHDQLGFAHFPEGTVELSGIPFHLVDATTNGGIDCLRLRGLDHPDWPARTTAPIDVGTGATSIYILHAALAGQEKRESPTAIWTAEFVGGHASSLSVFEGRTIGAVGRTEDLENWQVAWRSESESGEPVSFGVTKWTVYSDAMIESLSCRAYRGAAPVILAVTVVEQPPAPQPDAGEFDEMGDPWDINNE